MLEMVRINQQQNAEAVPRASLEEEALRTSRGTRRRAFNEIDYCRVVR